MPQRQPKTKSAAMPHEVVTDDPVNPTLPGGAVITGKNTLQSFDVDSPTDQPTLINPAIDPQDDVKRSPDEPPISAITTTTSAQTAVAIAVDADIVYGEVATEPANQNIMVEPMTPWYKRQSTFAFLTIISLLLAVVLGLSIGLNGNGASGNSMPTSAPISAVTTGSPFFPVPVVAPTEDPYLPIRAVVVTSYINNITLSNQTITANGTTPESKALAWLINNDTALDTAKVISEDDPIVINAIGFQIGQRYALLTMWFQQNETTQWAVTSGWLVDQSECTWHGIMCEINEVSYSNDISEPQNTITQITFTLLGSYVGTISADIGLLTNLQHFELANTCGYDSSARYFSAYDNNGRYLQGSLPDSIGQWTALTYFDVRYNLGLTGTLPQSIGQWTALNYFDVSSNYNLLGALPDNIGQWAALTFFNVVNCYLKGTLPGSIGKWTALTFFSVNCPYFNVVTLPDRIGQWTAMSHFDISFSSFTGTLPDHIGQWTSLTHFDVIGNALNGSLPDSIGQLTALTFFDISLNSLNGTLLPDNIGQWTALRGKRYFNLLLQSYPSRTLTFSSKCSRRRRLRLD
jgi:hypothetical protein